MVLKQNNYGSDTIRNTELPQVSTSVFTNCTPSSYSLVFRYFQFRFIIMIGIWNMKQLNLYICIYVKLNKQHISICLLKNWANRITTLTTVVDFSVMKIQPMY